MRVAHWTRVARQFRAPTVTSVPCCVPPPTPALSAVTCLIPSYCPGPSSSAWLPGHRLKASWGLRMAAAPADRTSAGFLTFSSCSQGSAMQEKPQNLGQCAVFRGWGWGLKPQRARHRVYTSLPPRPCLKLQPATRGEPPCLSIPPTATPNPAPMADITVIIIHRGYCPVSALE